MRTMKTHTNEIISLRWSHAYRFTKSFCLGFATLLAHCVTFAAITNVDIQSFFFTPDNVTISVNDQVQWTWLSDFHNTVSDSSLWNSGINNTGHKFTNTFLNAGTFP